MKNIFKIIPAFIFLAFIGSSCDKVEYPNISIDGVDTTLFPGNFSGYTIPSFSENTNTKRNVLIEDFTGHKCGGCPGAATIAAGLESSNPGRVFVASIHAGPANNGLTSFQTVDAPDYPTDFTTSEGLEIASTFFTLGIGFTSNPRGGVSRLKKESGEFMYSQGQWTEFVTKGLSLPLAVNLQAKSQYFDETNGVYLHVETEFLSNLEGNYNIVVYAIKNETIAPQLIGSTYKEDYHHHNVHLGNVFGETWGRNVASGEVSSGTKSVTNFSYKLPDELSNTDMHFQIFVYDKATYEILQVIEHYF